MPASRILATSILVAGLALPVAGAATAAAAAPPVNPKVVIIVGPVAGTNSYRSDAESAAGAAKYTTNVVRVYSPTATWAKVQAALQGASVVIYMGHGNGWPSPYPPYQTHTKDGLGSTRRPARTTRPPVYGE